MLLTGFWSRPTASFQALTLPPATRDFGTLETTPIVISPPLEQIPRNWGPLTNPQWFLSMAPGDLDDHFRDAGLPADDARALRATAREIPDGVVVRPSVELLRRLSPEVRARLYVPLMRDERNRPQFEAYRYFGRTVSEWFGSAPVSPETRRLVEPLVYRYDDFLYFADIDLVRSQIADAELQRLVKALLRHATVLARLSIPNPSELPAIIEYWGRGGRRTDIRPLLESIAQNEAQIDISHLLPPLAREHLYRYPKITAADLERPALNNCFWTALNFFNPEPDDRYLDLDYALTHLRSDYYVVHNDLQLGDVIAFLDDKFDVFHVAVYVADDLVFSKNGFSSLAPWTLLPIEHLKGHYFQYAESWRLVFYRRKDL